MENKSPLIVIVGPTASGKSRLAIELAGILGGEVVSADSMQVYKKMDIGTGKVMPAERYDRQGNFIPHHLIDVVNPDEDFSVSIYQELAKKNIEEIYGRQKIPFLVGGTGLYIKSVIYAGRYNVPPTDLTIREEIRQKTATLNNEEIYGLLLDIDPIAAQKIHPHNRRRIIRALEVYELTGKPLSSWWKDDAGSSYKLLYIGLMCERQKLYARINKRVEEMFAKGFVEEVKNLLNEGYDPALPAFQALGYKEIVDYLQGKSDLTTTKEIIKKKTRRYAKRQLTWFSHDKNITWYEINDYNLIELAFDLARIFEKQIINLKQQ